LPCARAVRAAEDASAQEDCTGPEKKAADHHLELALTRAEGIVQLRAAKGQGEENRRLQERPGGHRGRLPPAACAADEDVPIRGRETEAALAPKDDAACDGRNGLPASRNRANREFSEEEGRHKAAEEEAEDVDLGPGGDLGDRTSSPVAMPKSFPR